ncbi:MAG TPA: thiamine phosphate synthase [Polyangiaceae bacterium]
MKPRLILITDPAFGDDGIVRCIETVGRALPAGSLCVQLRDKQRAIVSLRVFASRVRLVTRSVGASLVINGDAPLARDVGADGVHLGRDAGTVAQARSVLGSRAWISASAHSDGAVRRALRDGADAVLVSPVFPSRPPSVLAAEKEGRGLDALRSARTIADGKIALYALGGVDADNTRACAEAGADGVAVVRALLASPEPARVAKAMHDALAARC